MNDQQQTIKSVQPKQQKGRPTIGFFNGDLGLEWTLRPWWGAVDAARKYDANLLACFGKNLAWTENFEEQANVVYDLVKGGRLDGLVIWKAGLVMTRTEEEIEKFCRQYGVPVVTMEGAVRGIPNVTYENYQGMKEMVDHMIEVHGYQRIGIVGLHKDHAGFQKRAQAYVDFDDRPRPAG